MHSSKLIKIFRALSSQERIQLRKFIHSPFFVHPTQQARLILLYTCIDATAPTFSAERLKKEKVYAQIFPDDPYRKGRLEKLMTSLLKKLRTFIHVQYAPAFHQEWQQLRSEALFFQNKQLSGLWKNTHKHLQKIQSEQTQDDRQNYLRIFLIEDDVLQQAALFNARQGDLNVPSTLHRLDRFYFLTRLEYTCTLLAQIRFQAPDINQQEDQYIQQLLPLTAVLPGYDSPSIRVYLQAFRLLQNIEASGEYEQLKSLLDQYTEVLSPKQKKSLHAICRNYCIYHFNKGKADFLSETYQRYRIDLEQGFLFHQNGLLPSTLKNLVDLGLRMQAYPWVAQLLNDFQHRITGTNHPEDIYRFNKADFFFRTQQLEQALQWLSNRFADIYYKIAAKRMEIKIFFDSQNDLLDDKMDAFKIYLFRLSQKRLSEPHPSANNNFIDALRQIRHPLTIGNEQRINRLYQKLLDQKIISEKAWLLQKLEEMK